MVDAIGPRLLAFALLGAMVAGCASTGSTTGGMAETRPAVAERAVNPADLDDMSFMHDYLVRRPTVSVDEAYRAMLILADGQDTAKTFEQRQSTLEQRGVTRSAWGLRADQPIDKGSIAYMVCAILKIQGGVNRVLFGSWGPGDRRYALRELTYRDMMATSPVYRDITGAELADLLRRADDYMQKHHRYEMEGVEIGRQPSPGSSIQPEGGPAPKANP